MKDAGRSSGVFHLALPAPATRPAPQAARVECAAATLRAPRAPR